MTREFWLNLPVKDINRSKEFFKSLGFPFNENVPPNMGCMYVGDHKAVIMLVTEELFRGFTSAQVSDTSKGCEVLISIDAASREEVDELASKAEAAGGNVFAKPGESQGWLYGCGFSDLDGHRWNILFRDMSKMPGK